MALTRFKELAKLSQKDRDEKMKELRFELVKAGVTANRTNAKTKEIKRAISRLMTLNNSGKEALKNK